MKYHFTNNPKEAKEIWLGVMRCPKCGYETTVTNIHRSCPQTPATEELVRPIFCYVHKVEHFRRNPDGSATYLGHQHVVMEYSGCIQKMGTNRRRKFIPKNEDEKQKLWLGLGVVFECS